jgi:hypothetical protein
MLLTQLISIKIHKNYYEYYKNLFPLVNIGDIITISSNFLHPKSTNKIECQCDVCGNKKTLEYRHYVKNTYKYNLYTCSAKCCKIKREKTNLEKYGYLYHSMNKEVFIEKVKKTSLEKYGKDFYMQTEEYNERVVKTNMEKFGVRTPLMLDEIKDKIKNTNIIKYGYEHPTKNKEVINKIKKTNLIKYGFEISSKSPIVKQKTLNSNINKYGVSWPNQNQEIYNKIQKGRFKTKIYNDLYYKSSYELDFIKFCQENKILITNAPSIKYIHNNHNRIYFPDFYISSHNLIIEIKSKYTYEIEKELNEIKRKSSEDNGFNFIFIIDKNYDLFLNLIL